MVSNYVCTSCIRALRHQRRSLNPALLHRRTLITSTRGAQDRGTSFSSAPVSPTPVATRRTFSETSARPWKASEKSHSENESSARVSVAKTLRKVASASTETYVAYGRVGYLFKEIAKQGDYDIPQVKEGKEAPKTEDGMDLGVPTTPEANWWYGELGLQPTFSAWSQISFLHMYILTARFRMIAPTHAGPWHQHLIDYFSFAAESRMDTLHGITAASIRNRYLKDLFIQWRGVLAAYDEGLYKGDAVLATAVWRNLWRGGLEGVGEGEKLAQVTAWLRAEIGRVGGMDDEEIGGPYAFEFENPKKFGSKSVGESPKMKE